MRLSRPQLSWVLYDMGNAAFALIVRTVFAPMYFKICADSADAAGSTGQWGLVSSAAGIVAGILAPWLGAIADANGTRKRFFGLFLVAGLLATLALCFTGVGDGMWILLCYFIGLIAYMGGNSFYDSMLVLVAPRGAFHRLSSLAYGWGYIGGMIPFLFCLPLVFILTNPATAMKIGFLFAVLWWGILSIPLFRNVAEHRTIQSRSAGLFDGLKQLVQTGREIGRYRNTVLFLIAYFLYIDGVGTILLMATPISVDIGIPASWLLVTILVLQLLGFPFTLLYGKLSRRISARKLVYVAIGTYILIALLVGAIPFTERIWMKFAMFLTAAFLIGTAQGGIQSLSRSLFTKLIPPGKASEFFGFYNIFGKFTTVVGPVLIYFAGIFTGRSEFGIAALTVPFLAGALLLSRVRFSGKEA